MKKAAFTIRVSEDVRDEFHVAARLRGLNAAGLMHQFMVQAIREEKRRDPAAFAEAMANIKQSQAKEIPS